MTSPEPSLFPMFVKLEGRNCLVVGGGPIAESKLQSLLAAGANVKIIAPRITAAIAESIGRGFVVWIAREFRASDLEGIFLVVAATSDDGVNELIFRQADGRNILCNAVDQPPRCHFYFPAVVRRGALQIAISTAGLSPALAQRIRKELEAEFGDEYEQWLQRLGRVRAWLMRRGIDFERRKRLLHRLASRQSFERVQARVASHRPLKGAAA